MLGFITFFAVLGLAVGIVAIVRKQSIKIVTISAFFVGLGAAGWLGSMLAGAGNAIGNNGEQLGKAFIGAGVTAAIAAGMSYSLWIDLTEKLHAKIGGKIRPASKFGPILAILLPFVFPALWGALVGVWHGIGLADVAASISDSTGR